MQAPQEPRQPPPPLPGGEGAPAETSVCTHTDNALHDRGAPGGEDEAAPRAAACSSESSGLSDAEVPAPLAYRPELDGLRAVAVVPVVLYHFGCSFPGGFAGVDVFFVISGYLITSILLAALAAGTLSLAGFWSRRVRRLFPALSAMLAATLLAANFVLLAETYWSLGAQAWATLLLGANVKFYTAVDYFHNPLECPLLHCWSLAVEEHFYLLYPLLLRALWRPGPAGRRRLCGCLAALSAASLAVSVVAATADRKFGFYLLPARAWEMAAGGLLAAAPPAPAFARRQVAEAGGWAGLGLIGAAYFLLDAETPYPSWRALLPVVGALLFIASQRRGGPAGRLPSSGRLLAGRGPVFVGRMSYSLYLWHWPVHVLLAYSAVDNVVSVSRTALGLALSAGAGAASYLLIEPRFRKGQPPPAAAPRADGDWSSDWSRACGWACGCLGGGSDDARFLARAGLVWAALLLCSLAIACLQVGGIGAGQLLVCEEIGGGRLGCTGSRATFRSTAGCSGTCCPGGACSCCGAAAGRCMALQTRAEHDAAYAVDAGALTVGTVLASLGWQAGQYSYKANGGRPYVAGAGPVRVAVLGTSHCEMYGPLVERLAGEYAAAVGFLCKDGDNGRFGRDAGWDATRLAHLEAWAPGLGLVAWIDFWAGDMAAPWWFDGYDFAASFKALLARSPRLLVLGDVPTLPIAKAPSGSGFKNYVWHRFERDGSFAFVEALREDPGYRARRLAQEAAIAAAAAHWPGRARFVPVAPYFEALATGHLLTVDPHMHTLVYKDFGHLNADGADRVEALFRREFFNETLC
jgi:peptidoglycan/LPS O-acetylase OafA/YrhL